MLQLIDMLASSIPSILTSVAILVVGYLVGRTAGKVSSAIVKMVRIDDNFRSSLIGRQLTDAGYPFSRIISILVRFSIYILTIITALSVLRIYFLEELGMMVANYLPRLIGALVIFLLGAMFIEWLADFMERLIIGGVITYKIASLVGAGFKFILYLLLIFMVFDIADLAPRVISSAAQATFLAVALSIGLGIVLVVGWGLRDEIILLLSGETDVIKQGQEVEIGGLRGTVKKVSALLIRIEDEEGNMYVLPKRVILQKGLKIASGGTEPAE